MGHLFSSFRTDMAGRAPRTSSRPSAVAAGRFAVVAARFNEAISKKLADGAVAALGEVA